MANQKWRLEPTGRKIRVEFNGETVAETTQVMLMIEHRGDLHYYFPKTDVKQEYLESSDHTDHTDQSGYKGESVFWHLRVADKVSENAAWTYPKTSENRPDLSGYISFKWNAVDAWFEEDEEVFLHPRNPYHRIDSIPSSRHVKIVIAGETVAESHKPVLVFETNTRIRYYLPAEDVNQDYLTPTDASSICPYKGIASYWTVTAKNTAFENIVWSYPTPIEEQPKLKNLMAFWTEKDKVIELYVDGELIS